MIINVTAIKHIYLSNHYVDMRKSIDGLSLIVNNQFKMNIPDHSLFIFTNKARIRIKILYYENNGFWLLFKRLEHGKFKINESNDTHTKQLTSVQLNWYAQQIKLQQKKLFGSSSEKTVLPDQISLFDEIELESTPIKTEPELEETTYKRSLDISSLPAVAKIYDIENKNCPDCGEPLRKISENIRKELIYHPARYEIIEHVQYVYTCDKCEDDSLKSKMYKADMKDAVIYKSFASPSLLSYIIDNKFNKALPLYRQEVMFNQTGLKLSRQTMANWMIKLHDEYFKRMIEYMHKVLLQSEYLHADETTNQVINVPDQKPTTKSYMWVYKTGRSEEKQIVHFVYENTRSHEHPKKHLEGYHNILQSDGYQAYGMLGTLPKKIFRSTRKCTIWQ